MDLEVDADLRSNPQRKDQIVPDQLDLVQKIGFDLGGVQLEILPIELGVWLYDDLVGFFDLFLDHVHQHGLIVHKAELVCKRGRQFNVLVVRHTVAGPFQVDSGGIVDVD